MPKLISRLTATILINQSLSSAIVTEGNSIDVISMPAAWNDAVLTIHLSLDNVTYFPALNSKGREVTVIVDQAQRVCVSIPNIKQANFVKIHSGTSAHPVVQLAERILYVEVWE